MIGALSFKDIPFEELYDIRNDPFEQRNLARDPDYQEIREQLASEMFFWMKAQGDFLSDTLGYMTILEANYRLDVSSEYNKVPDSLENTLTAADFLMLHSLEK